MGMADNGVSYLDRPYTRDEIMSMQTSSRTISGNVRIRIDDLIQGEENAYDYMSEALVGGPWLNHEGFEVGGFIRPSWVILCVVGYVDEADYEYLA